MEAQKRLTLEGNIVISVGLFGHSGDDEAWTEGTKAMLDNMHKRKIDMADEVFIINVGGYIGSSTRSEIEYAKTTGKTVRYLEEADMKIRKSTEADIPRMMEIYAYARSFMAAHGNPNQWGATNWPPEELIRVDIAEGHSYVCVNENDHVVGTFYFNQGRDIEPTYEKIEDGAWLDDSPYGVVHRIASDGSGKGIGTFCINWAYDQCGHLRMDTHGDNTVMQSLLKKLGFIHCGTIYVREDNDPRMAFEKV